MPDYYCSKISDGSFGFAFSKMKETCRGVRENGGIKQITLKAYSLIHGKSLKQAD